MDEDYVIYSGVVGKPISAEEFCSEYGLRFVGDYPIISNDVRLEP